MARRAARVLLVASLGIATLTTWCEGPWTAAMLNAAVLFGATLLLLSGKTLGAVRAIEWILAGCAAWALLQAFARISVYRHATLAAAAYWSAAAGIFWLSGRLFFGEQEGPSRLLKNVFREPLANARGSATPFESAGALPGLDRQEPAEALRGLLLFAAAIALLCVAQRFTSQGKFLWLFETGYPEIYGPFPSYKDYAAFVELIFPLAVLEALRPSPRRSIYAGVAALLAASVILSTSRAGAALLAAEFLAVMALTARRSGQPRSLVASGLLVAALAAILSFAAGWDRLGERFQESNPWAFRRNVAAAAVDMFRERPWTGFGMGNFAIAYPAYARFDDGTRMNHAHSDWLEWAVEGGAPLAAAMIVIAALATAPAARSVWGIGVLAVFAHALIDYPFRRLGVAGWIFFALAGVCRGDWK